MPETLEKVFAAGFREFLGKIKRINFKTTTEEIASLLKQSSSGIKSVDDALSALPVVREKHGWHTIANRPVGYINRILREGNLDALISLSSRKIPIGSTDRRLFAETVGSTPEKSFKAVADVAESTKRTHARLDVPADSVKQLSGNALRDVKKVESNLFKYFKEGASIALIIGVAYVGIDWIAKATKERKGCFMLTTINGKTTSCKVAAYTCDGAAATGTNMCKSIGNYYNVTLCLMACADLPDTDARKIALCNKLGAIQPSELKSKLASVIDTKYAVASEAIAEIQNDSAKRLSVGVCTLTHPDVESGKVPPCRMCSPTDNPISTTFIDSSQYADNITFQCVVNPSILDTIADVTVSTGKNVWEGITGGLSSALKRLLVIVGIIIGLFLVISIGFKFFSSRKNSIVADRGGNGKVIGK